MDTALATPEWQQFTEQYWQVEPIRFEYAPKGSHGPSLRALAYTDRKGRLVLPPYQPHLPLEFTPTKTNASYRVQRQWLEIVRLLVDDMMAHGIRDEITFAPVVSDPRPWAWSHFRVLPRFTNFIDFPFTMDQADRVARQQANKAHRAGFVCTQTDNFEDALACLAGSQRRKGFDYGLTREGMAMAHEVLGSEAFRVYVCYSANGEPATARIVLHRASGRACDWLAGTCAKYLRSGATQLLISHMMADLQQVGALGYNSCGADLEPVAYAKTTWGGRLMPQYSIQGYAFRPMRHLLGNMVRFWKKRSTLLRDKRTAGRFQPAPCGRSSRDDCGRKTADVALSSNSNPAVVVGK